MYYPLSTPLPPERTPIFMALLLTLLLLGFFTPMFQAFLPALIAFLFIGLFFKNYSFGGYLDKKLIFLIAALLLYITSSSLWAPNTSHALEKAFKLSLVIIPSAFLWMSVSSMNFQNFNKDKFSRIYIGIFLCSGAFLVFENMTHNIISNFVEQEKTPNFQYNRSYVVFVLLGIMAVFFARSLPLSPQFKKAAPYLVALFAVIYFFFSKSQTAQLAWLCALFFLFIFPVSSRLLGKVLFGLIILGLWAFPFILNPIQQIIPQEMLLDGVLREASIIHRFDVWNFVVTEIHKSPFYGHGLDAQRFLKSDTWMQWQNANSVLHPHNSYLQIWVEFGVIGVTIMSVLFLMLYKLIYSHSCLQTRRLYLTLFMTFLCISLTGYGLWQTWQIGMFCLFTYFAVLSARAYR